MKQYFLFFFIFFSGLNLAQSNTQLLIEGSETDPVLSPVFSPDGNKIAYTKSSYKGIWIYNVQSNTSKQLTDEDAAGFAFRWSSDSKSILTRVAKYENLRRYNAVKIFDIVTGAATQLNDYETMMPYLPQWVDGDTKIYLPTKSNDAIFNTGKTKNSNGAGNNLVVFEKSNKVVVKNLADNSEQFFEPAKDAQYINISTSPDNTKIVFEVMGGTMFVMNTDGSNLIDLGKGNRPRWSSNSKEIVYMITEDDGQNFTASDIFTINTDGTQKRNLTNTNNKIEMNPCFAPDGKSIIYDEANDGSIYLMNIE